jgi:hypothetical protein
VVRDPGPEGGRVREGQESDEEIYDCRHTYAMFSLAAGVSLFSLSRRIRMAVRPWCDPCTFAGS